MLSYASLQQRGWSVEKKRLVTFIVLLALSMLILIVRLFQLQVIQGKQNSGKVERVIRKEVAFLAPRGEIFDRNFTTWENSTPIVKNSIKKSLVVNPKGYEPSELEQRISLIEKVLGYEKSELQARLEAGLKRKKDEITLIDELTPREKSILTDIHLILNRFAMKDQARRHYIYGPVMAHITGYVGPPTREDLRKRIHSNQLVGKNGIEKYYDRQLRGVDGKTFQSIYPGDTPDEYNRDNKFIPGDNLVLSIDAAIQETAWKSLGDKQGAIIVLKPHTGEVLALISKPDYNPNLLLPGNSKARSEHLSYIKRSRAEINRAISTKYPPASTFKPLVALTAMEEKQISSSETHFCPGKFVMKSSYAHLPDTTFHCWDTHHRRNMITAIADSCSVYFYKLGLQIGVEPISRYSHYFQLDQLSQVDLPGEIKGFIPTPKWKEKQFKQRWFDGDTVNLSIGQGFAETTLIGMINFYSAIVTGGVVYKPKIVKEIRYSGNDLIKESFQPEILYELPISQESLRVIRRGLRHVVTRGTARYILGRNYLIPIAGKTGTVQTRSQDRFAHKTQHAWFIGYGPYKGAPKDQIVVGVFVEKGIGGAIGAAPIAHNVFALWTKILKKKSAP